MKSIKKIWSNLEIDLRPLKFSSKNLRPLIFFSENLRPLRKHSGRVFPINNVHPLKKMVLTRTTQENNIASFEKNNLEQTGVNIRRLPFYFVL